MNDILVALLFGILFLVAIPYSIFSVIMLIKAHKEKRRFFDMFREKK